MKYIVLISVALLGVIVHAQDNNEKSSKLAIIQSPGSYDDGFSIGVQYEHESAEMLYYGVEFYLFPDLHDMTYFHGIGRFGLHFTLVNTFRVYGGVRGGLISREGSWGYAMMGVESGVDWNIPWIDGVFIGVSAVIDEKTDSKRWGQDDSHTVKSGIVRIGIKF